MRLIRIKEVLARTGYKSPTTIWNLERRGLFPKRRRIGPNAVAWVEEEIESWMQSRAEGINAEGRPA